MRTRSRSVPILPAAPLAALALLVACGGGDPEPAPAPTPAGGAASAGGGSSSADAAGGLTEAEVAAAQAVYRKANCFGCHGHDAMGGLAGPTLAGVSVHWTAEDLADFIQNPDAWVRKDERIAAMAGEYALAMPRPMAPLSPDERLQLARWILTL